jgi:nicotinamide-nucleotide amidase
MRELIPLAEQAGLLLKAAGERISVAESSAGGLICAALLAVPGASSFCVGGAVMYYRRNYLALRDVAEADLKQGGPGKESFALYGARLVRTRYETDWALGESGVAGPTGNRYGHPPGHCVVAITGPVENVRNIETFSGDRVENMHAFARGALELLVDTLTYRGGGGK